MPTDDSDISAEASGDSRISSRYPVVPGARGIIETKAYLESLTEVYGDSTILDDVMEVVGYSLQRHPDRLGWDSSVPGVRMLATRGWGRGPNAFIFYRWDERSVYLLKVARRRRRDL